MVRSRLGPFARNASQLGCCSVLIVSSFISTHSNLTQNVLLRRGVVFPKSHKLTDGGVYDNLAINNIMSSGELGDDFDILLVSDAEGYFDSDFDSNYNFIIDRNIRANNISMSRVSELQLYMHDIKITKKVIPFSIKQFISKSKLSPEQQTMTAKLRTDLDSFSNLEVSALIAHGYYVAHEQLGEEGLIDKSQFDFRWNPFRLGIFDKKGTIEELKSGQIRKWELWSWTDWASWVSLFYVVIILSAIGSLVRTFNNNTEFVRRISQQRLQPKLYRTKHC